MLRARLVDSIDSEGIGTILHNPEAKKLLVSKQNGDVEVYSRENRKLKLFQTYPQLLQSSQSDRSSIRGLYISAELSTVFARCDKSLLLFNSTNLHKYDQIVDKRGISNCWLFEVATPHSEDKMTYLIYSTRITSKLRMLIWEGRIYRKLVEATLGSEKEIVLSANAGNNGIILATSVGVYHWSYGESVLSRIDKIVKRKYAKDTVRALDQLKAITEKKCHNMDHSSKDNQSFMSSSRITKKSSILNFWRRDNRYYSADMLTKVRYVFTPSSGRHVMFDGVTSNLFTFDLMPNQLPFMEATDHKQFIEWNCHFSKMQHLSANLLIVSNSNNLRFVDYENGFTFLQQEIPEGIRKIEAIGSCFFIVWTKKDQLQLFQYQVDDGSDDGLDDDESICGDIYDPDFYQLWRKVMFYDFFLNSPDALELCESNNREESLDLCALKLRDLTVLWCIGIFERLETFMQKMRKEAFIDSDCRKLEEVIIQGIFERFIDFWAPPQLVILKTFPFKISRLVTEMTGQKHDCIASSRESESIYDLPEALLRKWLLPYLVDVRRTLRNVSEKGSVTWEISERHIPVDMDFFLLNNHGSLDISSLLALIDTVLFETYLYYFPSMISPLLCVDNMCNYDIVVEELKKRNKFQELVSFYFQRGKHEEALDFLINLSIAAEEKNDSAEIQNGVKVLVLDYLKKLPSQHETLIFKYTEWLLRKFGTDAGILQEIFLDDYLPSARRDYVKVYEFIDRFDKSVSLRYLEFIISDLKSQNIELHTILIKRYFMDLGDRTTRLKLKSVLDSTSVYEPRTILSLLAHLQEENINVSADQRDFIEGLKIYPLQRLGDYKGAVDILYDKLNDYDASSIFCDKVYSKDEEAGRSILLYLFQKIINASHDAKSSRLAIFLQEHCMKLETASVYKLLPDTVLIHDLKEVLLQAVKNHTIQKDETRIKKNLLQVELINTSYELNKGLSNYIILEETYKCHICKKPFSTLTTDTALWFFLHKQKFIVHYTCGRAFENKAQNKKLKAQLKANRTVNSFKSPENTEDYGHLT